MRDVVILFRSFDRRILSRKTLLACAAGSNLIVRRIPFPDVGHCETGRELVLILANSARRGIREPSVVEVDFLFPSRDTVPK